jgi:hypothetical protein
LMSKARCKRQARTRHQAEAVSPTRSNAISVMFRILHMDIESVCVVYVGR